MNFLITTIIDILIIIGLYAVFLFSNILIRNSFKKDLSGAAPDLTIAAFAMQISVVTSFLTSEVKTDLALDLILLIVFISLWPLTLWQSSKKGSIHYTLAFIIGSIAFVVSAFKLFGLYEPLLLAATVVTAIVLGYLAATMSKNLYNENIVQRFEDTMGTVTSYDLVETSTKHLARDVEDPLSPAVDSIRCAIRNHDENIFSTGLDKITITAKNLMTGSRDTTVIAKHMNAHFLEMGFIAISIDRAATKSIIQSIGIIGTASSKHGSKEGAIESLTSLVSLFDVTKRGSSIYLHQQFVSSTGSIVQAAAGLRQEDVVEKGLMLLKDIGNNAAFEKNTVTMTKVTEQLLELARISTRTENIHYSRLIVLTMRDMGIRFLQEETQEGQSAFKKLIGSLRSMGKFFDQKNAIEVVWTMRDIGVTASRDYREDELIDVIQELNEVSLAALKDNSGELMQQTVVALQDICLAAMRSELRSPVKVIANIFSKMEEQNEFAVIVQDAVMDIGGQREHDDPLYEYFLRVYEGRGE